MHLTCERAGNPLNWNLVDPLAAHEARASQNERRIDEMLFGFRSLRLTKTLHVLLFTCVARPSRSPTTHRGGTCPPIPALNLGVQGRKMYCTACCWCDGAR